jgi:glycosyltransferase involved in cell wall biosynthesis
LRTLVFIPAFDEADSITAVVSDVRQQLPDVDVLVIDDGSADQTAARAKSAGARVASLPFNQGLGAALQTGYLYAERHSYDCCAHLDADGQHPVPELARMLELIWTDQADFVLGSRYIDPGVSAAAGAYRASFSRSIGIWLFRHMLSITSGRRFTDTTSGLRAVNRRAMRMFADVYDHDFHELESLQRAARAGLRIHELPVTMLPRTAGKTKVTPVKSAFFVFKALVVLAVGSLRAHLPEYDESEDGSP